MKRGIFLLLLSLTFFPLLTHGQFRLSGEFRPRGEYRNGYRQLREPSKRPAIFISQRSRMILDYTSEQLETKVSFQDLRTWGDEMQLNDVPSIGLHEAWGKVKFSPHYSLKLGRQELVYDDHRLLGNVNWTQQARSHDAAVFQYQRKGWDLHLGGAYNQLKQEVFGNSYQVNNYKVLSYIYLRKKFADKSGISVYGISDGFEARDTARNVLYRFTYGGMADFSTSHFSTKITAFGQNGQDINYRDIQAYFLSLNLGYKTGPLSFTAGMDYVSGTPGSLTGEETNRTFSTLYATNHKFYGWMDYFLNLSRDTRNKGLQDIYFQPSCKIGDRWNVNLNYHYFRLPRKLYSTAKGELLNPELGSEIDGVVSFDYVKDRINFKLGYSLLMATNTMKALKGGDKDLLSQWGWAMVTIQPLFWKE